MAVHRQNQSASSTDGSNITAKCLGGTAPTSALTMLFQDLKEILEAPHAFLPAVSRRPYPDNTGVN